MKPGQQVHLESAGLGLYATVECVWTSGDKLPNLPDAPSPGHVMAMILSMRIDRLVLLRGEQASCWFAHTPIGWVDMHGTVVKLAYVA